MTNQDTRTNKGQFPYGWEMAFAWCPPEETPVSDRTDAGPLLNASTNGDDDQTKVTRRYDRMAWLYDIYDAPMEWLGTRRRRRRLISQVEGDVLEVGVGTGRNLTFHPADRHLTGIDISEQMLARARERADRLGITVRLQVGDVTDLPFADDRFDTTVATCVFCSVGDPITGLAELGRVTKPEGKILLLEHVRPLNPLLGWLADLTERRSGRSEDHPSSTGRCVARDRSTPGRGRTAPRHRRREE